MTITSSTTSMDRPVNALEALAQIQDFLNQTNQTLMDSYAKAAANQSSMLDGVSKSAHAVADATAQEVGEYLKKQQEAAHQPWWKTMLKCVLAVVTIVVAVVTQQYWMAGALAAYFVLEQLPTGFDENGKPISIMDRFADLGMPKWVTTMLNVALVVTATVGGGWSAGWSTAGKWSAVAAGSTMLAQTGVVGDVMSQCGVDSTVVMWTNLAVGIAGTIAGGIATFNAGGQLQLSANMKKVLTGLQVGSQIASSGTDVASGFIQQGQFSALEEVAKSIGDLKLANRNLRGEIDSLNAMIKQSADGIVEAREDLTEQTSDINRAYSIIGRALAEAAA